MVGAVANLKNTYCHPPGDKRKRCVGKTARVIWESSRAIKRRGGGGRNYKEICHGVFVARFLLVVRATGRVFRVATVAAAAVFRIPTSTKTNLLKPPALFDFGAILLTATGKSFLDVAYYLFFRLTSRFRLCSMWLSWRGGGGVC